VFVHSFSGCGNAALTTREFAVNLVSEIVFWGLDGDDTFKAWHNGIYSSINTTIHGGDGNNYIMGGSGTNRLQVGVGDSMVIGGTGTNVFYNTSLGSNCFVWRGTPLARLVVTFGKAMGMP
jgi:Ca2+-binding RTX toxin-like protein